MKTKRINEIQEAVELLRGGEVVAFPTETVYGLGAVCTDETAVKKVYEAKGRPSDNPLIVHVSTAEMVERFARTIPLQAKIAMDKFWPGPLTIVLPVKEGALPDVVTAGLSTAAFRMPDQKKTLALIEKVGVGLVGPSANTSGKPSPTSVSHVLHDLNGKISGILDGGESMIGLESTVIDCSQEGEMILLRPGAITSEMLQEAGFQVKMDRHLVDENETPKAPGLKYTHYSPEATVYMVAPTVEAFQSAIDWAKGEKKRVGLLADEAIIQQLGGKVEATFTLTSAHNIQIASQNLFAGLRELDEVSPKIAIILAETFDKTGLAVAYMNRLEKSSGGRRFGERGS